MRAKQVANEFGRSNAKHVVASSDSHIAFAFPVTKYTYMRMTYLPQSTETHIFVRECAKICSIRATRPSKARSVTEKKRKVESKK